MVKVAIMGYGVVGSGVAQVLTDHYDSIAGRAKEEIDIKYILDLRDFPDSPFQGKFIKDFAVILNDPEVRVVAEVMGCLLYTSRHGKDRRNLFALCQRNAKHRQPGLRKGGGQPAA